MTNNRYKKVRNFLLKNATQQSKDYFGCSDPKWLNRAADNWMNDKSNSEWIYEIIEENFEIKKGCKILDMASGCGTFVFYGLVKGYDVYGIEPEEWKNKIVQMKIGLYNYPIGWQNRFLNAFGENLPFKDNSFNIVSSYQTLEHVTDVKVCLKEILRVTKNEGIIFLHFPDYRSWFEAHYRLPWVPLFPKKIAKIYLKIMNKPIIGLDTINYVTKKNVINSIKKIDPLIKIVDLDKFYFNQRTKKIIRRFCLKCFLGKKIAIAVNTIYTYIYMPFKRLFHCEKSVAIIIQKIHN